MSGNVLREEQRLHFHWTLSYTLFVCSKTNTRCPLTFSKHDVIWLQLYDRIVTKPSMTVCRIIHSLIRFMFTFPTLHDTSLVSQRPRPSEWHTSASKYKSRACYSPVSRAVHGSQRGQVVRAAEVSIQSVLSGRQVSGGARVGGGGEQLHWGAVMGGTGASVQAWKTNKANLVNVPNKLKAPVLHLSLEQIKSHFMATGFCFDNFHPISVLCKIKSSVFALCVI